MTQTPKALRLHIGIFGRRNVGKSSLLNALLRQQVSIVSEIAGTTTDPVEKPMELLPLGPVQFIDTAGIDDEGALGELRIAKTRQVFDRTDLAIVVTDSDNLGSYEQHLLAELTTRRTPTILVRNKADVCEARRVPVPSTLGEGQGGGISAQAPSTKHQAPSAAPIPVSAKTGTGLSQLRDALLANAPADFLNNAALVSDLVPPGELAILVVPIDKEAPKGRLIMPQVQAIRDLLDGDSMCMVVKERELKAALDRLKTPPALVVTDSQAFLKVAADVPHDVPMTSFSILMSRFKGDLVEQVRGAKAIDTLKSGDRVLIAEACSHHPIGEDIARVKIPRWLTQYAGAKLEFTHTQGHDFPPDLDQYKLVIHCGGCMFNRREMLTRIGKCRALNIPVTNYGMAIAYSLGIFERALGPFPAALEAIRN